ncbi:MAG TPA: hypothetical protein VGM92_13585 [Candidatus Kapabacteria bacterium]
MRNRLLLLLTACVSLGIASSAFAQGGNIIKPEVQTGFLVGPVGGINLVAYNTDQFPILNIEPTCFLAQNGSDVAAWGGVSFEFPMGNPNELQNFIVGEVLYDSKSSKFSNALNNSAASIPTKLNGYTYANSSVSTTLSAQLSYVEVNLAYKYNFTPGPSPVGPGLQVGPVVGIKTTASYTRTVNVISVSADASQASQNIPADQTASNSSSDPTATSLRIALRAAATYDLSFSNDWIATPIVGYDFPITKVDPGNSWRASALFAGIAFRYFIRG